MISAIGATLSFIVHVNWSLKTQTMGSIGVMPR